MSDKNQCAAEGDVEEQREGVAAELSLIASVLQGYPQSMARADALRAVAVVQLAVASIGNAYRALAANVQPKGTAKIDYRAECWPESPHAKPASDDHGVKAYKMAKALADHLSVRPAPESQAPAVGADDARDAARYRWLLQSDWYIGPDTIETDEGGGLHGYCNENFDAKNLGRIIDAALSKGQPPVQHK